MIWFLLIPITLGLCFGSWASYEKKQAVWYIPAFMTIQVYLGLLWCYLARHTDCKTLYSFGLVWDVLTVLAYTVMPLVLCGVKLGPAGWVGFGLMVVGTLIVKVGG